MELSYSDSPIKHLNGSSSYSSSQECNNKNGDVVNGYSSEKKHKDKHKDKHRDKDRHKHKSHKHDKDRDRNKDRDREKEKSSSSSHKSSSNNNSDKDKSKYDKIKSEKSSPEKSKTDSNSISSSKDKDRDSFKDSSKHHKSKHKEKHREKDRDREKDRERHRDKEKDRERAEKDKDRKSSSSSGDKAKEIEMKMEPVIKPDPGTPVKIQSSSISMASVESDDDDIPLGQRSFSSSRNDSKVIKKEESDDDDVPLALKFRSSRNFSANSSVMSSLNSSTDNFVVKKKKPKRSSSAVDFSSSDDELLDDDSDGDDDRLDYDDDEDLRKDGQKHIARAKQNSDNSAKKRKPQSDSDDDDKPLISRKKVKTETTKTKKRVRSESEDSDADYKKKKPKSKPKSANSSQTTSPTKRKKAAEEEQEVWKWWEEAPRDDGVKWNFLEHRGPVFAPLYEPLPKNVQFRYNGKTMKLSSEAEEVAGFYSRFIEHEYTTKEKFNTNFFKDWRKVMTKQEREVISDLSKCDFRDINEYYKMKGEERKAMSKEEKLRIKEENEAMQKEYGICVLDGHKEKIGNFKIEPPGLFRGRGDHPKMGMLKKRVTPEDVTINCSKDSKIPKPPEGHKWKEVRHDNTVTWLACWVENVQGQSKYVMLNPTSRLKGEKDWMKYEKARELAKHIETIRETYKNDFKSKEMRVRQRAVALYFIDRLALRAGNEKDEDQADTVGCCSLRFEHVQLFDEKDDKENVVVFDFLGKDSIRYYNEVPVEKRVYKNLKIFMDNKKPGDDLFDRLNTLILNKHLSELMDGLTAKVFRTYNASHTLQQQLDEMTPKNGTVAEKILAYNRANRAVAILCNHQRAVPKSHEKSMENLMTKIKTKRDEIKKVKKELKDLHKGSKDHEKKSAALRRLQEQLEKLELQKTDKEEGKEIALGTSKLNYLDPRITVSWCKKYDVPVEKVYNKTQRAKFRWAIDMADKHYRFD